MSKTITDSYLGTIQYSDEHDWYQGKVNNTNSQTIEFNLLDLDIEENLEEALEYVRMIIKDIVQHSLKYKLFAAEHLLELYNDTWSEEEIIDINEFANHISLEAINFYVYHEMDNTAEIYYQDGDLFAGHAIIIRVDSQGNLEDADIAG